jgi:hypothetical protein
MLLTDEWGEKEGRRWSIRERAAADDVRGGATRGGAGTQNMRTSC